MSRATFANPAAIGTRISGGSTATLIGVIDGSVVLAYILNVDPPLWHLLTLALKSSILLRAAGSRSFQIAPPNHFVWTSLAAVLSSVIVGRVEPTALFQALGFIAHLSISVWLVQRSARVYLSSFACVISAAAALHTAFCLTGRVPNWYGRYFYFNGSHFNLGGEIGAVGALAGYLSMRRSKFLVLVVPIAASVTLMQARAAMLAIAVLVVAACIFDFERRLLLRRAAVAVALAGSIGALYIGALQEHLGRIFLINDQYRGGMTDFVGRGARWQLAVDTFLDHPFLGAGLGYFDAAHTPHNFFLYALSEHGTFGVGVIVSLLVLVASTARRSVHAATGFGAMSVLFAFNDRFMNSNPYPLVLFVALICFSASSHAEADRNAGR